jgi:hypothetical protein
MSSPSSSSSPVSSSSSSSSSQEQHHHHSHHLNQDSNSNSSSTSNQDQSSQQQQQHQQQQAEPTSVSSNQMETAASSPSASSSASSNSSTTPSSSSGISSSSSSSSKPAGKQSVVKKHLSNALSTSAKRIQKELAEITLDPPPNCSAGPKGDNIYEWFSTIYGPAGSVYESGTRVFNTLFYLTSLLMSLRIVFYSIMFYIFLSEFIENFTPNQLLILRQSLTF